MSRLAQFCLSGRGAARELRPVEPAARKLVGCWLQRDRSICFLPEPLDPLPRSGLIRLGRTPLPRDHPDSPRARRIRSRVSGGKSWP